MTMRVAILGAGGVACGMAALLASLGHTAILWSRSGAQDLRGAELTVLGAIEARLKPEVADDIASAVAQADAVILAMPANGHRATLDAAIPHLRDGQTIIISAQLSFSALYLFRRLEERGIDATVVAWSTTVVMGQRSGAATIRIGGIRKRVEAAVLRPERTDAGLATCRILFGDRFAPAGGLIAIALGNLNPPVHMANALCNLTRIEKAEHWGNYDGITPAVARLIEALDRERLALAAAYGTEVRSVETHFRQSFDLPGDMPLADMTAAIHDRRKGPPGPTDLGTRFVTEDIPFGICQIVALAAKRGISVPLHESGLQIFDALCGRDFAAENDLLPGIDLNDPLITRSHTAS